MPDQPANVILTEATPPGSMVAAAQPPKRRGRIMKFRFWLLLLAVVALIALFGNDLYWYCIGTINHEAFYKRRPTSYWMSAIQETGHLEDGAFPMRALLNADGSVDVTTRKRGFWESWLPFLGGARHSPDIEFLLDGPDAVPVLKQLLKSPDPYVKTYVLVLIFHKADEAALPALSDITTAITDENPTVAAWAKGAEKRLIMVLDRKINNRPFSKEEIECINRRLSNGRLRTEHESDDRLDALFEDFKAKAKDLPPPTQRDGQ